MPKAGESFKEHMETRMHAFKKGKMHSRKKRTGPVVRKRKQAIAIALSEAREAGLKGAPRAKRTYKRGSGTLMGEECLRKVGALK